MPQKSDKAEECFGNWTAIFNYIYQGPKTDEKLVNIIKLMTDVQIPAVNTLDSYSNWYEQVSKQTLEPIYPTSVYKNSNRTLGGLPSVLISR